MNRNVSVCINAFFVNSYGISNYCRNLILEMKKLSPELRVRLLVYPGNRERFEDMGDVADIWCVPLKPRFLRLIFSHALLPILVRRYQLVHSVGNIGLIWSTVPQVISIMDLYEKVSPERFGLSKRLLMSWAIALSGRSASSIIAISKNTAADVAKYYPALSPKVSVIYLGNSFPVARGSREPGPEAPFLFVGTLEPGKNLTTVLRAMKLYLRNGSRPLDIIGAHGSQQEGIERLIDELGISTRVTLHGFVDDRELQKRYAAAFALILPSLYEGFGLPVIEAMACGCPVIAARNSAIVEAGGEAALFFETLSETDLCEKMQTLEQEPELRKSVVDKGFNHAARFRWAETARQTLEVYDRVLGSGGASARHAEAPA